MPFIFKKQVTDINEVPVPLQSLYQKGETGYSLPDDVFQHVDPTGFQSALDKERKAAKEAAKALEPWRTLGEDPTSIQAQIAQLKEEAAKKDTTAGQFEKFKQEVAVLHQKEKDQLVAEKAGMERSLESYLIESEATRILSEAKGSPALLMPHIKSSVRVLNENGKYVVRVVDSEGDPRISAQTGNPLSLSDLVNELKGHAEFGKAFEPSGTTGSGMRPGNAGTPRNPGDTSKLSATEKIAMGLNRSGVR